MNTVKEKEISYIKGFISYEDYLKSPVLEGYLENGIEDLPDRCQEIIKGGKKVAAEKKKINGIAILTILMSLGVVVWAVLGYIFKQGDKSYLFAVGANGCIIENIISMFKNLSGTEIRQTVSYVMQIVVLILTIAALVGSVTSIKSNGTGMAMKIGTFVMFLTAIAIACIELVYGKMNTGTTLLVVFALLIFFVNIIARKKIKK